MTSKHDIPAIPWLVPQVARPSGVDLAQAVRDGVLTPQDYLQTVSGCRSCDDPDACARWLDAVQMQGDAPALTATFCKNAPLVVELHAL